MRPIGVGICGTSVAVWGYIADLPVAFWPGMGLLALSLAWGSIEAARGNREGRLTATTSALALLLLLAGFEVLWRAREGGEDVEPAEPVYSYAEAQGDPRAFRRWWRYYLAEWKRVRYQVLKPDPRGLTPWVPIPGSVARFLESEIRVNQLGFRGPEVPVDKDERFRIVALGESTTWGATIHRDDRPWPELLQQRIGEAFDCDAPVEVINAGVPGLNLKHNLARFDEDIVPLAPDLLLSYHGYNGFLPFARAVLADEWKGLVLSAVPVPPSRPSTAMAWAEHAVRSWAFSRWFRPSVASRDDIPTAKLLRTSHAETYRELVERSRAHHIDVALCSFNLAVNAESPEEVIDFYQAVFPLTRAFIVANRQHSRLIRELRRELAIATVDTSAGLDGAYSDSYIDLAHYTQLGRERLAANILDGIGPLLREHPRIRCRPRGH